jgi:hypothetical protein
LLVAHTAGLAALLLLVTPFAARADDAKAAAITVPLEVLRSKHLAVKVRINGKGPYRLIFDTGAPFILINMKTAHDCGLIKKPRKSLFSFFNSAGPVKIKNLDVGGVKLTDTHAAVMDHPTVELMSKALGRIDGLIGYPFFARYRMTIDYQAKTLVLTPSGFPVNDADADPTLLSRKVLEGRPDTPAVLAPAAHWGFVPTKERDEEADGVTIKEVLAGSAAAAGGLRAGDRLLTLDGRWTDSIADTFFAAQHVKPGTAAKFVIRRAGKEVTLTVTPRSGL